jgi:hypothetical protein
MSSHPRPKPALPQAVLVPLSLSAMGALLFLSAGRLDWRGGWIFAGLVGFSLVANALTVRVKNPVLRQERWKEREDSKSFDRTITYVYLSMLLAMTLIGGRELPGYAEYARSTRYRLVPFVW